MSASAVAAAAAVPPHLENGWPSTPEEITASWLTSVLRANGVTGPEVESFTGQRVGTGQVGINTRIEVKYKAGTNEAIPGAPSSTNDAVPLPAPTSFVAKMVSPDPASRTAGFASQTYLKEAAFYRELAPKLRENGMRIAQCWCSEYDDERQATVLLLEDLAPCEAGNQLKGATVQAAELAVIEAAKLHATFWGSPDILGKDWLGKQGDPERLAGVKKLYNSVWPGFVERYKDRMTDEQKALGQRFGEGMETYLHLQHKERPLTILHGDFRVDNLLFAPADEKGRHAWAATVDWQTLSANRGGMDVGYFIANSLSHSDRKAHQKRLVELWHTELVKRGVKDYSLVQAWDDYRLGQFLGLIMSVVSSMWVGRTERGDDMFWMMAERHFETAIETNAEELILPAN